MSDAVIEQANDAKRTALGTLLIERGILDQERLDEALRIGAENDERLGEVIVRLGWASEEDLAKVLAEQWHLRYFERSAISFDGKALRRMSREDATRLEALPIQETHDGSVVIALAEPTEARLLALRSLLGDRIDFVVVARGAIEAGLRSELLARSGATSPIFGETESDDTTDEAGEAGETDEPANAAEAEGQFGGFTDTPATEPTESTGWYDSTETTETTETTEPEAENEPSTFGTFGSYDTTEHTETFPSDGSADVEEQADAQAHRDLFVVPNDYQGTDEPTDGAESSAVGFDELARTLSEGLTSQLASLRQIVVEAEARREQDRGEIERLESELRQRATELSQQQLTLDDRNETIRTTQETLDETQRTLDERNETIRSMQQTLREYADSLEQR